MKKRFKKIQEWMKTRIQRITPGKNALKGAARGLLLGAILLWIVFWFRFLTNLRDPWVLLLSLAFVLAIILFALLIRWSIRLLYQIPKFLKLALLITLPALFFTTGFDWALVGLSAVLFLFTGAAIYVLKFTGFKNLSTVKRVITLLGLVIGVGGIVTAGILFAQTGFEVDRAVDAARSIPNMPEHIEAPSPARKGTHQIRSLTYGSGSDRHRPEYGADADLITDPVNGLPFIDSWDGFSGWWRENYWGFDSRSLPLNARVWYPEGDGPFPLVLVVHGNHGMQDYSDPGYDYLGELLASKGMILASVDENFINGSWSDIFGGLDEENDARGWLLLEHLRVWHEWNREPGHEFYQKVDTANLALIGHSRGGEAVAHAALFNTLPYYPDDASQKFDYDFALQSIVAIAPVDGQYEPGESRTEIKNVNYLVLHGAQDADVTSYMGSQQYERIHFEDSLYHFKAGLYVYGANHGQFNTSWGNNDRFATFTGLLNLKQLLPAQEQERIAEVYIGGFLDATLRDKKEYLPLFIDARRGRDWLPETLYLNQFEDSSFKTLATFDEDFDLSSLTEDGGTAHADNLTVWREQEIELKWQQKGSRGLFLGWNYDLEEEGMEDVESGVPGEAELLAALPDSSFAQYTMRLPSFAADSTLALVFSMAESTEASDPKSKGKWVENEEEEDGEKEAVDDSPNAEEDETEDEESEDEEGEEETPDPPLDMTIQLTDSLGHEIAFPLSRFSPLQREIEVKIMKTDWIAGEAESEKVFQTFYFPFTDLREINPEFDLGTIEEITIRFDRSKKGVVVIDQVGLMESLEERIPD